MTQIAAIAKCLLDGQTLDIAKGFKWFACSNIPRELSRSIEQKFNVTLKREKKEFTSRYGHDGFYYEYSLPRNRKNKEGIKAMHKYYETQFETLQKGIIPAGAKTDKSIKHKNRISETY